MKYYTLFALAFLFASFSFAQTTVSGILMDEESGDRLVGASVVEKGTTNGTTSDVDGKFSLQLLGKDDVTVVISFVGFADMEKTVTANGGNVDIGKISLQSDAVSLEGVNIIASVAIDRETPVAVSTIKKKEIQELGVNQEFPEVLRNSPSIYVTKQGGGFGDSRINVRGFDQRNTAVMINGVPVNDMENGWVYWSNWAGLTDVASSVQVQRGLGASKLSVSSVGGTINIITNPAEHKKGGTATVDVGNNGYQKYGLVLSTGRTENGLSFTVQGTHTRGNGWVDGTKFEAYSYFAALGWEVNEDHMLNFTVLGAPQWHHQRSYASPYYLYYGNPNDPDQVSYGRRYNDAWGYYQGEEFSWRRNFYHKPKAFINWSWDVNDKMYLTTTVYASAGRGGGTGPLGGINGNRDFSSALKNSEGNIRFDDIAKWHQGYDVPAFGAPMQTWRGGIYDGQYVSDTDRQPDGSYQGLIRRASMNEHNWYGLISNLQHNVNENLTLNYGIDFRSYVGLHYRRTENLFGASAYYADGNVNEPDGVYITEGDRETQIEYSNNGYVRQLGGYLSGEYTTDQWTFFAASSISSTAYAREDLFAYEDDDDEQKTDWNAFLGGTVKGGANYRINDIHNVFANVGWFSRAPFFDGVFPTFTNEVSDEIYNEKVLAYELGYGIRTGQLVLNLNAYYTNWQDKQFDKSYTNSNGEPYRANILGQDALHQGLELDFAYNVTTNFQVTGMVSAGDWKWKNNVEAIVIDDNTQEVLDTVTVFADGLKVGDAAQLTADIGFNWEIFEGFTWRADYFYADNLYADFVPTDKTSENPSDAWQLPAYGLLNSGVSYNFMFGKSRATVRLGVNNILDEDYITESETDIAYDATNASDYEIGKGGSVNNRVFTGFGTTWSAGIRIQF